MAKKYDGLLTVDKAKDNVAAGFKGWFVIYGDNGDSDTISWVEVSAYDFSDWHYGVLGFAPEPGYFLPMATAPRDGRWLRLLDAERMPAWPAELILQFAAPRDLVKEGWSDGESLYAERGLLGWSPIVTVTEVPDGPA